MLEEEMHSHCGQDPPVVLVQFSQDTTRVVRQAWLQPPTSGPAKKRKTGQVSSDYLMQCLFVLVHDPQGVYREKCIFAPAMPVKFGKTAASLAACALEQPFLDNLPMHGSTIRIRHQVFDRGVPVSVAQFLSGRVLAHLESSAAAEAEADEERFDCPDLYELHTYVGCAAHDAHNALKWSQYHVFSDSDLMSHLFIGLSALRTSVVHSLKHLSTWLVQVIEACPSRSMCTESEASQLWTVLGVSVEHLEVLTESRCIWQDGKLRVLDTYLDTSEWLERLSCTLFDLWRFSSWTMSRWATLGPASRNYVVSMLLGYGHMFETLCQLQAIGGLEQAGYERITDDGKRLLVSTALVSHTSETFLTAVLEDNRVALRKDEYKQAMVEEVEMLQQLPHWVWTSLCSLIPDCDDGELKSFVLAGSLASYAYLDFKVFSEADQFPWRLVRGPLDQSVDYLANLSEAPDEPVTQRLHVLLQSGVLSQDRVKDVLAMLGQVCWTADHVTVLESCCLSARISRLEKPVLRGIYSIWNTTIQATLVPARSTSDR